MADNKQSIKEIIQSVADQTADEQKKIEDTLQIIVFSLDKEEYGVLIDDIREIIKMTDITPVPDAPNFIRGILNLRGKIVVIIDLEKKFNLKREHNIHPEHIIITEVDENNFGVIVDVVTEVLRVPVSNIKSTSSLVAAKIEADYLSGVVVLGCEDKQNIKIQTASGKKNAQKEKPDKGDSIKDTECQSRLIILLDLIKILDEKELLKSERNN